MAARRPDAARIDVDRIADALAAHPHRCPRHQAVAVDALQRESLAAGIEDGVVDVGPYEVVAVVYGHDSGHQLFGGGCLADWDDYDQRQGSQKRTWNNRSCPEHRLRHPHPP